MSHTWIRYISASQYCSIDATPTWAHPVLALLSKAETRPLYHHPTPAGKGKSWQEVCVCLSTACQQCPRQQGVRIHTGTTILSACGTGETEETGKASKTWEGGEVTTITWDSQWAKELVMEGCHTCHYLSLPKTLYSAVISKQHQCNERATSYCPPLIQNAPNFWEQLHRQLQSSFSRTRPLMFTKLCVLQDFLTSARLHTCRMWVFTATTKLVTANTFWLHVQLNSRPKWS